MKFKGRKVIAFISTLITFIGLYVITLFKNGDILKEKIGIVFLILIFANSCVFISFNSLDKFIKSKWFNINLFNKDK